MIKFFRKLRRDVDWLIHTVKQGTPTTWAAITGDPTQNSSLVNYIAMNTTGVNVLSDTSITFGATGYYTYTGEEDITSTLPPNGETAGTRYVILNTTGAGILTIEGNIFESGSVKTELSIAPGENYIIYNNGQHWVIV